MNRKKGPTFRIVPRRRRLTRATGAGTENKKNSKR